MYPIKQSTAVTIPFFVHDAAGDAVTGLTDGTFTKRISKNGAAFGAMTVTISEMENGWYSIPLSTSHSDTLGLLTIVFTNGSAKQVNLQFRVHARLPDDLAYPTVSGRSLDVAAGGEAGVDLGNVTGVLTQANVGWVDANSRVDVGAWLGTAVTTSPTTAKPQVDVDSIDDDAAAANNLEADYDGVGYNKSNSTIGTCTANTDMRGTDGAALASAYTAARAGYLDNINGHTPQTGDSFARLGAPAGASVSADIAAVQSDTDDIQTRLPAILTTGTSDSGSTTTVVDAARTEADADYWKNSWIRFTSGNISGQVRLITAFDPGTDTITFAPATTQAVTTQNYEILPAGAVDIRMLAGGVQSALDLQDFADAGYDPATNKVEGVKLVDVTTTNSDMRGTDSAALASVCTEGRLSELDAANLPTDVSNVPANVWDRPRASHLAAGTFGQSLQVIRTGTAQAGAASSITLDAGASSINNFYSRSVVFVISGTGVNQARRITSYNGTTKVATVANSWSTNPASGSVFMILPRAELEATITQTNIDSIADAVWDEPKAGHVSGGSFGEEVQAHALTSEVSAVEIDTQDIQSRLPAALVGGRMDSDIGAKTGNVALSAQEKLDVNAEVDSALDTAVPGVPTADSINERIKAIDDKLPAGNISDFDETTDDVSVATDGLNAAALAADAVTEIWGETVEVQGSYTAQQVMSIILSVLAGVTADSGATLKTPNGVANRVAATVNASQERTAMTLTPSS